MYTIVQIPFGWANCPGTHCSWLKEAGALAQGPLTVAGGAFQTAGAAAEQGIQITEEGLAAVIDHLAQFGEWPANQAMIDRLSAQLGEVVTGADANFYTHELMEANFMGSGMTYDEAHTLAIQIEGVSPFSLYHPEVIEQCPECFNANWRAYWGIDQ